MARAHFNTTATAAVILSLICIIISSSSASDDPDATVILHPPHSGNSRHTMFLPLYHSLPQTSRISSAGFKSRRHLHNSDAHRANARMPLHDDLLLNGYYTTRLYIGTPPQKFALIVDTGSTVTYVPCSTCEQCGKHQDPKFDPESSSTYKPVKCNIDCLCDNDRVQCLYERQYAEMSSSSGVLGEDIVSFGNQSELTPQQAVFGCENVETGDLYSQRADGIMGLGRGELSIVDQLVSRGVISDSFSLCYGGMDVGGGAMVLGGISPPADMVFAHSDPQRSPYYNIELKEIHVAGKRLALNPSVFDGKHGTVLDSGTTYAYLPEAVFSAFKDAIMKELHSVQQVRGPDPSYNDICFSGAGHDISHLIETFPAVEMVFRNGQKLLLSPENYLFRHSKVLGAYCLGVFQNGKDPTTLLGGIIVRNTFVMYDREHERVGFWKTNCSEIWERLQISDAPPQVPPTLERKNSTVDIPPTMAPIGPPTYVLPGETEVGSIIFSISLDTNYSNLKDHVTELTQFIAQELNVNTSQVHLLNSSSNGNNSITKWAILPAGSAESMSNDAATTVHAIFDMIFIMGHPETVSLCCFSTRSIVSRIAENRVHLPATFGHYQFSEWKVEPPHKRSWWQQHNVSVIVALLVFIIFGLSAFGTWFVWKQRQQSIFAYKPVDANTVVAEQELQLQPQPQPQPQPL